MTNQDQPPAWSDKDRYENGKHNGRIAYQRRESHNANPYRPGTWSWIGWRDGFSGAAMQRLNLSKEP